MQRIKERKRNKGNGKRKCKGIKNMIKKMKTSKRNEQEKEKEERKSTRK